MLYLLTALHPLHPYVYTRPGGRRTSLYVAWHTYTHVIARPTPPRATARQRRGRRP